MLFESPKDQVSIKTILELCLMYRGSQPPTVKHLVDGMEFNRCFLEKLVRNMTAEIQRSTPTAMDKMIVRAGQRLTCS